MLGSVKIQSCEILPTFLIYLFGTVEKNMQNRKLVEKKNFFDQCAKFFLSKIICPEYIFHVEKNGKPPQGRNVVTRMKEFYKNKFSPTIIGKKR